MAVPNSEAVQRLSSGSTSAESRSGRVGPITLGAKQTGERSARNPHAAFDEAGAGNVAWPRWCDTRNRKSEPTGNTNFGLNRRASPRPYLRGAEGETPSAYSPLCRDLDRLRLRRVRDRRLRPAHRGLAGITDRTCKLRSRCVGTGPA